MAHGYRAVSTRQVAEAVGLTQPALYHHFATQADLYQGLLFSATQDGVAFGDTNWNQVDFYKMAGADLTKLMAEYRKNQNPGDRWGKMRFRGGATADVLTWGLDDGQVTKGGTSGKTLFIR